MIRLLLSLLICASLQSATYYVRKDGSDSNTGTSDTAGGAWLTIGKAASVVNPGDTVDVRVGTYQENVTLTRSGTSGNPIRWNGTWDTIVDPSVAASSGWVQAPEKDAGNKVYKHTSLSFTPSLIIADGMTVLSYTQQGGPEWDPDWLSGSTTIAASPSSAIVTEPDGWVYNFWDGMEAFWWASAYNADRTAIIPGATIYIRFKDGSNPNSKSIRIVDNDLSFHHSEHLQCGFLVTGSYNEIRGFAMRNAWAGVSIRPGSTGTVVSSNKITATFIPISINSPSNYVSLNHLDHGLYGTSGQTIPGAWRLKEAATAKEYTTYLFCKNRVSTWSIDGPGIMLNLGTASSPGHSNVVTANVITNCTSGLQVFYTATSTDGRASYVSISSNLFYNSSSVGMMIGNGNSTDQWQVHDNLFSNVNIWIRRQRINNVYAGGYSSSKHYFYRNKGWNPGSGRGGAIYCHVDNYTMTHQPEDWYYHNTFESPGFGFDGILNAAWGDNNLAGNIRMLNNILSVVDTIRREETFANSAGDFGGFDHNRIRQWHTGSNPPWRGPNNITNSALEWASSPVPDFELPAGSLCISKGPPVHQSFTLLGTSYPALPGYTSVYYSGTLADLGAVPFDFGPPPPDPITNVLSIEVSSLFNVLVDGDPDDPDNVPPLFTIRRADVSVGGELVANTNGVCPFTVSVSSPDGAVADVDYTVFQTSGEIADETSSIGSFVVVKSLRNGAYTGQRTVRVTLEPGAAYELSGTVYADVILLDADLPPGVIIRPQPKPGHGILRGPL